MTAFSKEIGKDQLVFDVAAGYGRIAHYIDPSNTYYGIDLNKIFVDYGTRQGVNLELKDIFDSASYKKANVFTLVDVVHHLSKEKLIALFDLIFQHTEKKVVIIEPAFVDMARKYGLIGRIVDWFFKTMDDDGFNTIHRWFSDQEYSDLFSTKFGSSYGVAFSLKIQIIANHYLVTFTHQ
jgi:SAM-dependent methyltransferase